MNDFVTKPIDPAHLVAVMLRWTEAVGAETAPAHPAAAPAAGSLDDRLAAVPGLDAAAGLRRMMGKKPLFLAMLRRYVNGQRDCPADVRAAMDNGDWPAAERLAHTAGGLSGNVGAIQVEGLAQALEVAIRQQRARDEIDLELRAFEKCLMELIDAIEFALPDENATPPV